MPTERQRLVARRVIAEGRTISSVAEELGVGAPSVRDSLFRYCLKLMPELKPHLDSRWDDPVYVRDKLGFLRSHRDKLIPKRRIYLAGPMTGLPDFNYPAFHSEAARLRALGYLVENPAENPAQDGWEDYMKQAIPQLLTCDLMALLPGWHESKGAMLEHHIACNLGIVRVMAADIGRRSLVTPGGLPA
ncbi:DUF4406 domain-containing protein [Pseudomonas sp. MOB-449]|nr:DUF4406 domain-containing protein [Pseudomonas sp. MOB-449]